MSAEELLAISEEQREEALELVRQGELGVGERKLCEASQIFHRAKGLVIGEVVEIRPAA